MSSPVAGSPEPSRPDGWRRFTPWQGTARRGDVALMSAVLLVVAFGLVLRPLTPFLIARHPVLLEFLSGDLTAVGAAAAFARIGEAPLWLVILVGALGMVKFDAIAWWAGRRWGQGIITMFTGSERVKRWAAASRDIHPNLIRIAVVLAMLPGVPTPVVFAVAGWTGMRLTTFLALDLIGALGMTSLVAGLGFALGQSAVDVVLLVDRYASAVSLALLATALLVPLARRGWRALRRVRPRRGTRPADGEHDRP